MSKKQSRKGKYIAKALRNPVPKKSRRYRKKRRAKSRGKIINRKVRRLWMYVSSAI